MEIVAKCGELTIDIMDDKKEYGKYNKCEKEVYKQYEEYEHNNEVKLTVWATECMCGVFNLK